MALVGVVANDAIALKGNQDLHERIAIGAGTNHRVCRDTPGGSTSDLGGLVRQRGTEAG